jgi:hypothetical protein
MRKACLAALMLIALAACGGGEDEVGAPGSTTQTANCGAAPELCR